MLAALDAKLEPISVRIDAAALPGTAGDRLPAHRNLPAIAATHDPRSGFAGATTRIR